MKYTIWKIVGFLSIIIFLISMTALAHAATLTTTVTAGSNPIGVAYDPNKNEIFVSNYVSGDVQVISDSTNQQVADITMPSTPYDLAYDSSTNEIWVAGAAGAYAISDATNQVVASVTSINPNWNGLTRVACDPGTGEVFVSYTMFDEPASPYILVISESSNTVIANVTRASDHGLAATGWMVDDSAKNEIFATDYTGTTTSGIYVISAKTNTVTTTIPVANIPEWLVYDSGKGEIFVGGEGGETGTNSDGYTIQVISDSTNKVVASLDLPTSVNFAGPMAYNSNKGEIYVNAVASVAIISDSTNKVQDNVNTNGIVNTPEGIAYDSGTGTVYAINNDGTPGSIAVISDTGSSNGSNSNSVPTSSPTSTANVPEFSSPALALIAVALAAVTLCALSFARKKQPSIIFR